MLIDKHSVYIVTGGASGLGAGVSRLLREAGAQVLLADCDEERGQALAQELSAAFVRTEVSDEASATAAIQAASALGHLRGVVNCAGIAHGEKTYGKDGPHSLANFQRVININLVGSFNMIRLAATEIARQTPLPSGERGVIVNTASVAAFDGQIGQAAYAAAKGGIVSLTLPLARELAREGIRVMTIAPGIFATPMIAAMPQEVQDALGKMIPFPPRLGQPAEFAALVRHIIENPMLNGEVIRLDGAIRMQPR